MLRLISKVAFHIFSNTVALIVAAYFVVGFSLQGDIAAIAITAIILTGINTLIKPILKLFLGPLILLTFGLFSLVINAITLFILDFFSAPLTIQGYVPLIYGTLIVTAVNIVLAIAGRQIYKN
ncbi:MAG: phage holin family protein [Candidatus Paceibacterota bacterium]